MRMHTNYANKDAKLVYPKLSYLITGLCFEVHNQFGRFSREKQYGDLLEEKVKEINIFYTREERVGNTGNVIDFAIDKKVLLELKAKQILTKEDYYQTQKHLQSTRLKLGLLVNFRSRYSKPKRIIRIDTDIKNKFL